MRSVRVARDAHERNVLSEMLGQALDSVERYGDASSVHQVARRAVDGDEASLWEWSFYRSGWGRGYSTGKRLATSNTPQGRVIRGMAKTRKAGGKR